MIRLVGWLKRLIISLSLSPTRIRHSTDEDLRLSGGLQHGEDVQSIEDFLSQVGKIATTDGENVQQDFADMCTRGKEKKKAYNKIFKSLHRTQLPLAQKITRKGRDHTDVTTMKVHSLHGLIKHARNHSNNHNIVPPLYGHQDYIEEVVAESMTGGQKRYIVQWADTYMLCRHIYLHAKTGYKPAAVTGCHKLGKIAGPVVGKMVSRVQWQQKDEPATEANIPTELIDVFQSRREALGHIKLGRNSCSRRDEGKSNLQKQGDWLPLHHKPTSALLHNPGLKKHIDITPMTQIMTLPRLGNTSSESDKPSSLKTTNSWHTSIVQMVRCVEASHLHGCFNCIKRLNTPDCMKVICIRS